MIPDWVAPYIGIPFRDRGRERSGCDCWGLVRMVLAERAGVALPSYSDEYLSAQDRRHLEGVIVGQMGSWFAVDAPQPLDVILMRRLSVAAHIGVAVTPNHVLHVESGRTSAVERMSRSGLSQSIVGYYRHKDT